MYQNFIHVSLYIDLSIIRQLFPEKPLSLIQYYSHQAVLIHGNTLKQIDSVPKLINEVCKKIKEKLESGEYFPEHVASAFYDLDKPVFTSPFYLHLLGLVETQDYLVSVDETAFNSPVMMSEQINTKIRGYKVIFYIVSIKYLKLAGFYWRKRCKSFSSNHVWLNWMFYRWANFKWS